MTKKADSQRKAKDQSRRPDPERAKLKDSLGAWKMSDEEEERTFSSLKKNWKRTTLAIRTAEEKPPEDDQDVDKLVKSLLKLKRTGKEPLILRLNKPATAVVASGRDRWHM